MYYTLVKIVMRLENGRHVTYSQLDPYYAEWWVANKAAKGVVIEGSRVVSARIKPDVH